MKLKYIKLLFQKCDKTDKTLLEYIEREGDMGYA
jgi:hypothetical protein